MANLPVGFSGSGACALWERSGNLSKMILSFPAVSEARSGFAGSCIILPTLDQKKSSAVAMCSATCAIDQRSGAALNFHWASLKP